MTDTTILPGQVANDISIYLTPDEKVLKAVDATPVKSSEKGQVWLILTTHSVFFHTCQKDREPLIALLERRAIKEIEYFQRVAEIVLTFVPSRNPGDNTRLAFSMDRQGELEDFCEDLADLIVFRKETAAGVKTYDAPSPPEKKSSSASVESELRHAASAVRHRDDVAKPEAKSAGPTVSTSGKVSPKPSAPDVKIAVPGESAGKTQTISSGGSKAAGAVSSGLAKAASASSGSVKSSFDAGYVVAATVISILVAFLWYQFFKTLATLRAR